MFDPILELRRRRMLGVPQVTGNVQPPDVGPDITPAPAPLMAAPVQMQAPVLSPGPDFSPVTQLGAERGINFLLKRLRKPERDADALQSLPVLKNLFRR